MSYDYRHALQGAEAAARAAGRTLRDAFHANRQQRIDLDAIDHAVEDELRRTLGELDGNWPVLGEEGGLDDQPHDGHLWVVDPHDGTEAAHKGWRGASVSIGLLCHGLPVLGVVFAYAAPDDDGDLIAWAQGCGPMTRNGRPITRAPWAETLDTSTIVAVSQDAGRSVATSIANAELCAPARFLPVAGIAYRLARAAVGDADAVVSLGGAHAWDIAAAHALLHAHGADLYDSNGQPVTYTTDGNVMLGARSFAGSAAVVHALRTRPWDRVFYPSEAPAGDDGGNRAYVSQRTTTDAGLLSRAQGALLGQFAGDALGGLVEFQSASRIAESYTDGPRQLVDGGHWETIAGQPTDDSEMALALARSLVDCATFDDEHVARAYATWYTSGPFDIGGTTRAALAPAARAMRNGAPVAESARAAAAAASPESQANGSLMRIVPLGVFGHNQSPEQVIGWARRDASITHPHPACCDASAVFAATVAHAIASGSSPEATWAYAVELAETHALHADVQCWLRDARTAPPETDMKTSGWVKYALQNAFWQLLHASSLEEGIVDTVRRGGDTDTNAAIAGALLGAVHGRDAVPSHWRAMVETCRAARTLAHVRRARPSTYWPSDVMALSERLLVVG